MQTLATNDKCQAEGTETDKRFEKQSLSCHLKIRSDPLRPLQQNARNARDPTHTGRNLTPSGFRLSPDQPLPVFPDNPPVQITRTFHCETKQRCDIPVYRQSYP